MPGALAFLSYTRKDDDFFGGYITEFRKLLENAVHVVTGDRSFRVFQDVEGIVLGENWQKKLNEVVDRSSFFVPMLSPLFFNSDACRDESEQFLAHERSLERDDLILPIYFLTCPRLEKPEERAKDGLATAFATRQMYDWREQANTPIGEPATRTAILGLARAVEGALGRLDLGPRKGGREESARAAGELTAGVAGDVKRERLSPRKILWVDDKPENNVWERHALESYGVRFTLARDTSEAERLVGAEGPFAAIISDLGRPGDAKAGFTLLSKLRDSRNQTPYFIYTAGIAAKLGPVAQSLGTQGLTDNPDALVEMVVSAIR